ncbi:hypothetical protein DSM112329_05348 [Paraconexibacter sp. AEG42_29]|uniref:Uncharacterized protein n=2 Tax=Paraconexibacter sp. AEG42_29 TaxID=2997339 RepID=A0AAU7B3J9_9ACTN
MTVGGAVAAFAATWPGLRLELNHGSGEFYKGSGHDPVPDDVPVTASASAAVPVVLNGAMDQHALQRALYGTLRLEPVVWLVRGIEITGLRYETLDEAVATLAAERG